MVKAIIVFILTSAIAWSYSPALRLPIRCNTPKLVLNRDAIGLLPSKYQYPPLYNSHKFALDKSVLPNIYGQPTRGVGITVLACSLFCIMWALVQSGSAVSFDWLTEFVRSRQGIEHFHMIDKLKEVSMALFANMRLLQGRVLARFSRKPRDSFSLGSWNVCKLARIEPAGEEYSLYRFQLPAHPETSVKLDIGQEIILCLVDAKGRALKKGFFVSSAPTAQGYFEVLCKNGGFVADGTQFCVALQFMEPGDELAVKAGPRKLTPQASVGSVTSISILAHEEGIVPTLQLLRAVLEDPSASVEQVEVLWVNHSKKDFVLNEQLEELQRQYGADRLRVTRVVDREAGNANTRFGEQAREAVSPYTPGRIAVVMAESAATAAIAGPHSTATTGVVQGKCLQLLASRGYPNTCISQLHA